MSRWRFGRDGTLIVDAPVRPTAPERDEPAPDLLTVCERLLDVLDEYTRIVGFASATTDRVMADGRRLVAQAEAERRR